MSTDYEPGTVAVAKVRQVEGVRVMRTTGTGGADVFWVSERVVNGSRSHAADHVTDVRPLVVLDLGDYSGERAVNYLRNLAQESRDVMGNAPSPRGKLALRIADQIEAQTKPPRIPEPGLWGVVEAKHPIDGSRVTWVHGRANANGNDWFSNNGDWCRVWSDLIDPTLIREGVES